MRWALSVFLLKKKTYLRDAIDALASGKIKIFTSIHLALKTHTIWMGEEKGEHQVMKCF